MMSSLLCSWGTTSFPLLAIPSSSSSSSFSSLVLYPKPKARNGSTKATRPFCSARRNDDQNQNSTGQENNLDRRNMLIGLGGLYSAANLGSNTLESSAAPIPPPDLSTCRTNLGPPVPYSCCPPTNTTIVDFTPPTNPPMRTRPAAHLATAQYMERYNRAVQLMRNLPANDPRNFMQQSYVHCAYCNGAYFYPAAQGLNGGQIQVHGNWLFFPFHRWYLYFHERILGSLINDPTFALPYWNWDSPDGMNTPTMYNNSRTYPALFNERRNQTIYTRPVNLATGTNSNLTPQQIANNNCAVMYNEMISTATTLESFMGRPYRRGNAVPNGAGTSERGSHNAVHNWCGDPRERAGEDMGNFYSAGRDPIFYCHHSNVDRMWTLWRERRATNQRDFTDTDYLNSQFLFYDENRRLVRVRVADCLDTTRLGYQFQTQGVTVPWTTCRPAARVRGTRAARTSTLDAPKLETLEFPLKLDKIVKVLVHRPRQSRTLEEKEKEEEDDFENFDKAEYLGTFSHVPHKHDTPKKIKAGERLELDAQLEELDVEGDEEILITLVPLAGDITIGGIKISYASSP
ncbi:Polyphenol oxidase, chloroplastic [Sesamum alatum]|uniref:Polyphenol oxidase, chloroplastic n=1 Tax=Sesamum alatum TaxID=300844 RepID=A0AAE2CUP1_9LAMI|nr:Polyphenol oxidase, chloroplastic [Sesamum alatum]